MNSQRYVRVLATAIMAVFFAIPAVHGEGPAGAVYTMTNAAAGNEVVVYNRFADGSLQFSAAFGTAGYGSGDGLGNQGGVVLSDDGRWLFVVNAGSNEVSVFRVDADGLTRTDTAPSGGTRPVSVAIRQNLVYVVNAGGLAGDVDSVSGLRLASDGILSPYCAETRSRLNSQRLYRSPAPGDHLVESGLARRISEYRIVPIHFLFQS